METGSNLKASGQRFGKNRLWLILPLKIYILSKFSIGGGAVV